MSNVVSPSSNPIGPLIEADESFCHQVIDSFAFQVLSSWTMLKGHLQTGQEGCYTLAKSARDRTSVTYDLTIHHNMPLPGFVRSRVIKGLVDSTLNGLKKRVEAQSASPR